MKVYGNHVGALHGFTGNASSWDRVRRRLEARGLGPDAFRVYEMPGHGGQGAPTYSGFESAVLRIRSEVSETLYHDAHVHLVGYSLGARLALGLLFKEPYFRSATLIGVRAGLDGEERVDRSVDDYDLAWRLETEGLEAFVERWESLPLFASQERLPEELLREQRRVRRSHDPRGLAWVLRHLGPGVMPDFRPRLGELEQPVHLMVGERDERFLRLAEDWIERVRGTPAEGRVELEVVPDAGHNLPLEAPDAVAAAVRRGFDALPEEGESADDEDNEDNQDDNQESESYP